VNDIIKEVFSNYKKIEVIICKLPE
jgi:hypothetical protein